MINKQLYGKVRSECQFTKGQYIRVILNKLEPGEWPRLLFSEKKHRNIRYDVEKSILLEEKKENLNKKRILTLDLGEEEKPDPDEYIDEYYSDIDWAESDIESENSSD